MPTNSLPLEPKFTIDPVPLETVGEGGWHFATRRRSRWPMVAAIVVLALAAAAAYYFFWLRAAPQQVAPAPPVATPAPSAEPEPAIEHPVEKIAAVSEPDTGGAQLPLPKLDGSDIVAKDAIDAIVNGDAFARLLVPSGIIRHIVATIDNLPRKMVAVQVLPIKPVPGLFATTNTARGMSISADNAGRYTIYVKAAQAIDTKRLAGFYVRLYPLFQQAYAELGYPRGYFNDRLISVIDHLLAAPEPKPPVYVTQPKIMFAFADPDLEALSAGQKILVRIGLDNELRLKAKLRDIRKALTAEAVNTR